MAIRLTESALRKIVREEASRLVRTRRLRESLGGINALVTLNQDGVYIEVEGDPISDAKFARIENLESHLLDAHARILDEGAPPSVLVKAFARGLRTLASVGVSTVTFDDGRPPVPLDQAVAAFQELVDTSFTGSV